jgi:hypothetical protein
MSECRQCGFIKQRNQDQGCRYCPTSRAIKKMKDVTARVKNKLQKLWLGRKKG